MVKSIQDVVTNDLCVSCGACCTADPENVTQMVESKPKGIYIPVVADDSDWGAGEEFDVCPGKGYPIKAMGESLFPNAKKEDIDLGRWHEAFVTRSLSEEVLEGASSGGIMTALAAYLLSKNIVQGVVVTGISYTASGPRPKSVIATSFDQLKEAQGSKYCPVPIFGDIGDIERFNGKLAFIGTPCQIAALRLMQETKPHLKDKVLLTIGNFCGGYRDLRETDRLIERASIEPGKVEYFRYRGGGQPGSMLIKNCDGVKRLLPYPDYARMTGIIKFKRCRLCVDATAELADISCGDAWIKEYLESGKSWSIVVARSQYALGMLYELREKNLIELNDVTIDEIKSSQKGNLTSKKVRQDSRLKLYKLLGMSVPEFDGGYHQNTGGLLFELKVHLSHLFFSCLEKVFLYKAFAKLIKRYPKGL